MHQLDKISVATLKLWRHKALYPVWKLTDILCFCSSCQSQHSNCYISVLFWTRIVAPKKNMIYLRDKISLNSWDF